MEFASADLALLFSNKGIEKKVTLVADQYIEGQEENPKDSPLEGEGASQYNSFKRWFFSLRPILGEGEFKVNGLNVQDLFLSV